MESADRVRQGQPIKRCNPVTAGTYARSMWSWFSGDPMGAAIWIVMVPVDVAIVAWIVVAWRKRS
jgi:hypothetical protein